MGFLSASATGGARLSSAQIFGAGKFVGGVVDDFIGLEAGCGVGTKAGDFAGNDHQNKNEQCLQQEGRDKAAVWADAERGFAGETCAGASEGGTDVGGKFVPARRPLDEELGSVVAGGQFYELESFDHVEIELEMRSLRAR
jgi:hypothetical protein